MNMFWLDEDMERSAIYTCDRHIVKMPTEYTQILNNTYLHTGDYEYMKMLPFSQNHPAVKWCAESLDNWMELYRLALCTCVEYTYRYDRIHACMNILRGMKLPSIDSIGITTKPQLMPDDVKDKDVITAYRNYYRRYKRHLLDYKRREIPYWIKE